MTPFISVYITAPTTAAAEKIAQALAREKRVACVNIFPQVRSVYRWQGEVEAAKEVVLIAKTRATHFAAVEALVKSLHPYDCPCIVALPITAGHAPYLDWLDKETDLSS